MRYSEDLIEEVRSRNNIVDVIGEYVKLKRTGSNYVGLCPFHNEKTGSFSVSQSRQMYYCFGCHKGGNVITFLMEYNNYSFPEALEYLAERAGMELPKAEYSKEAKEQAERRAALLEIHKKAAAFYYYCLQSKEGRYGLDYLKKRGLTDETIRHFGLGYSDRAGNTLYRYLKQKEYPDELLKESGLFQFDEKRGPSDKFWNRVMFPILDVQGRVIGFGGRVMGDGKPKYLNSPETTLFNKRNHLYALNYARASRERYLILCEGYMDVITMHQAGFTNACASLGTALTSQQASLLRRFTSEVLLLYDSDGAGRAAALRAIPILKDAGISARVVPLSPYKDPDELIRAEGAEGLKKRLSEAQAGFLFEIGQMAAEYDLRDPEGLTRFQRACASALLRFPDELERTNYLRAVAEKYHFSENGLAQMVKRMAMAGTPAEHFQEARKAPAPRKPKESGEAVSEKLLLAWLVTTPGAYAASRAYLGASDFSDPLCRKTAEYLYPRLEEGSVSEAALISRFEDVEEQNAAAALFRRTVPLSSPEETDRAFTDTVLRIARASNDRQIEEWDGTDMQAFAELIARKKELEELSAGRKLLHLPRDGGRTS